jgi:hypothetical protein
MEEGTDDKKAVSIDYINQVALNTSANLSFAAAGSCSPSGRLKDAWVTVSSVTDFMVAHRSTMPGLGKVSASYLRASCLLSFFGGRHQAT